MADELSHPPELPKNKGGRPKVDSITLTKAARARFDTLAAESIEASISSYPPAVERRYRSTFGRFSASSAADHWPVGRNRSMSRLSCEMLVTPISFMSRSISARMLQSAFSTPGCPAAASA
jgi:hypothetical protein